MTALFQCLPLICRKLEPPTQTLAPPLMLLLQGEIPVLISMAMVMATVFSQQEPVTPVGSTESVYTFMQGTSMAAPHVAGVVALMKAIYSSLTPALVDAALGAGDLTEDIGSTGRDDLYGYGLIDGFKAVQKASSLASSGITNPILSITPSVLNFGSSTTSLTISVVNGGGGSLNVTGVSDDASWLTVTATSVDGDNLGTYTATVNRSGLIDSNYPATITFTTNVGTGTIPVSMTVGTSATSGNAGNHYILLVDPSDSTTKATITATYSSGSYSYQFTEVEPGDYLIIGGTDSDADGYLCDNGEACGGYPSLDLLETITISESDLTNQNFLTGFYISLENRATTADLSPNGLGFSIHPRPENDLTELQIWE